MRLIRGLPTSFGCVLTLGNFDGVHLGHQALLKRLREAADRLNLPVLVLTFEPEPGAFFFKHQAATRLTSLRDKLRFLKKFGVDVVCCLRFDARLANLSALDFASKLFATDAKLMLLGDDCKFGRGREGDLQLLSQLATQHDCRVDVFPPFLYQGMRVSSTAIRQALERGELSLAAALLGRPYTVFGRVIKGLGRGRQVGLPTANLLLKYSKPPLLGVYVVQVRLSDNRQFYGVANWGTRPTVGGVHPGLEVHVFDMNENCYGMYLDVLFLKKIRAEKRFESMQALVEQIHQDIREAKDFLQVDIHENRL